MPIITIRVLEGHDDAARARLGAAVTQAVCTALPAAPDSVVVMIDTMPAGSYFRAGQARGAAPAGPAPADPVATVRAFLEAMERRDLEAARALLDPGFTMTFPGDARMTRLEDLIDWARPRYRGVYKTYEGFDAMPSATGSVVYSFGTLSGTWHSGETFEGIRFIDRFELAGGRIVRQQVWNDMAETVAAAAGAAAQ
jgi:phenylpyruvate tautomerase PptA (4-oxalocrotonate tautomerase family)/ketosteroid isomerase-like protein